MPFLSSRNFPTWISQWHLRKSFWVHDLIYVKHTLLIINTLNRDYGKTSLHVAAVLSHSQPHTSTKSGKTPLHEAAEKQSICKEVFFYSFMKWSLRKYCHIRLLTVLISTSVNTYFVDSNNFVFGPGLEISSFSSMFQNLQIIINFSRENWIYNCYVFISQLSYSY